MGAKEYEATIINQGIFEKSVYRKCLWCPYGTFYPSGHKTGLSYEGLQRERHEKGQSGISRFYVLLQETRAGGRWGGDEEEGSGGALPSVFISCGVMFWGNIP